MTAYKEKLRQKMSTHFQNTRKRMDITQEQMAELLEIDSRSYSDLERGKCLCSTPVFLLYVLNCNVDTIQLFTELKAILSPGDSAI